MEQAVLSRDIKNLPVQSPKQLSFSALIEDRYAIEFKYDLRKYAYLYTKVKLKKSQYLKSTVRTVIAGQGFYTDVHYRCTLEKDGSTVQEIWIVRCYCSLDDAFDRIVVTTVFPKDKSYEDVQALPDDLIPRITKENLDDTAAEILKGIYPKAVQSATRIDAIRFAKLLGLSVQFKFFDPSREIFGKIFFEDTTVTAPHPITREPEIVHVKKGTIWINTQTDGAMDSAAWSNTIMHECIHWLLHRPAFLLAKALNQDEAVSACRRYSHAEKKSWSYIDRMEWQANSLAPRILMPKAPVCALTDWYISKASHLPPMHRMEKIIDKLANDFCVSRQLSKIRLQELGFMEARYAFTYYEKRKYEVSFPNIVKEYQRNPDFKQVLESGQYAYVDRCLVLCDRKYIARGDDGVLHLTEYAKAFMDKCCLAFVRIRNSHENANGMYRYIVEDEAFVAGSGISVDILAKRAKNVTAILNTLPASFGETLVAHMKRKGMTAERLSEYSFVSVRQIKRYRNDLNPGVKITTVICLCIGLKLHPMLAFDLINKAGISWKNTEEHTAYKMLLYSMTNSSIADCNSFLRSMGYKQLGHEE